MKKKTKLWCITMCSIALIYTGFLFVYSTNDQGEAPMITFDNHSLQISVNADTNLLLVDVHAKDKEDGNLTKDVVIDSISPFDEFKNRIVTYAVFDSDGNVTKAQRMVYYSDYTKPRFYLKNSFVSNTNNIGNISSIVGATSCVDGDISSKVNVKTTPMLDSNILNVTLSVKDSTGETSTLDLKYNYDRNNYTTDIRLQHYLVYVKAGEEFNAERNIKEISSKSVNEEEIYNYLNISDTVDYHVPGIYEVTYSFNYFGDNGFSKCIVVVE